MRSRLQRMLRTCEAWCCLCLADLGVRLMGASKLMRLMQRVLPSRTLPERSPCFQDVAAACSRAGLLYFRRTRCLERSLTIYFMAARRQIPVRLNIGVRKVPFASHAWVECAGQVMDRDEEIIKRLKPILTFEQCRQPLQHAS